MPSARPRIITLLTDFGDRDWFVGTMKGVILSILPSARIVDLSHAVPTGDIRRAAWILACAWRYFPRRTVHVAVVDPGVGSTRAIALLETGGRLFLAPDNGVLSYVLAAAACPRLYRLDRPDLYLPEVSATFHGRDVFAPVAARLAAGLKPSRVGPPLADPVLFPFPTARRRGKGWNTGVVYIDRFGNVILSFSRREWDERVAPGRSDNLRIEIGAKKRPVPLAGSYALGQAGDLLALWGSSGQLELAVNRGSAADRLGVHVGDEVFLEPMTDVTEQGSTAKTRKRQKNI
ncbi:MAG: SAM-dependent chlorinase/fluorinase [Candidatus Aureabacteria bacterium]|nr:SAM-dependent chlorinase/fluorinase [Candidatus Auribacterota bacterium]